MTKLAKKLVLTTIGPALEGKDTLTLDEVRYMLHVDDIEKAGNAADLLERTGYLDQQSGGQLFDVLPASFPGLCALYFEARVRHELDPEEAASFVHRMMSAA